MLKYETAQAAAESMGMRPNTYQGYERSPASSKSSRLNDQAAIRFGRRFGVRWEWLLTGEGSPTSEEPDPDAPVRRVLRVMGEVPLERQEAIADAIEALAKTATSAK